MEIREPRFVPPQNSKYPSVTIRVISSANSPSLTALQPNRSFRNPKSLQSWLYAYEEVERSCIGVFMKGPEGFKNAFKCIVNEESLGPGDLFIYRFAHPLPPLLIRSVVRPDSYAL